MTGAHVADLRRIESEIADLEERLAHCRQTIRSLWSEENESYRLVEARRRYARFVTVKMKHLSSRLTLTCAEAFDLKMTVAGESLRFQMR